MAELCYKSERACVLSEYVRIRELLKKGFGAAKSSSGLPAVGHSIDDDFSAKAYVYDIFMPTIKDFINLDFYTPTDIASANHTLSLLFGVIPAVVGVTPVESTAYDIFEKKNFQRGNLWEDMGFTGALIEMHAKLARIKVNPHDEDSWLDLFNYCIIAGMCLSGDIPILKPQSKKKKALVTGCDTGGLGDTIVSLMGLNGIEAIPLSFSQVDDGQSTFASYPVFSFFEHKLDADLKFDYVVNNHGRNHLSWLGELGYTDYSLLDSNVKVMAAVVNSIVRRNNPCRILNIASQTYRVPQRCTAMYCASKAAVVQFTKVAARELAPKGYIINALAPGKIEDTAMSEKTDAQVLELRGWGKQEADAYSQSNIPMGRNTCKQEVALAVMRILNLPEYINGAVIDMTGGQ